MALRLLVSAEGDAEHRVYRYDFDDHRSQILLGRRGGVDVLLPHAAVSLVHARIERHGAVHQLVDDRSTNGTWLNGVRLPPNEPRALRQGDRITIAGFLVEIAIADRSEPSLPDNSISMARRMVVEVLDVLGPAASHPMLTQENGASLVFSDGARRYRVGRAADCDLCIDDGSVASEHVELRRDARGVLACALGSAGLYVNHELMAGECVLREGDVLTVGRIALRFTDPAERYLRQLEQLPTPEAPPSLASSVSAQGQRASERAVVLVAAAVAVLALCGLLYLWMA